MRRLTSSSRCRTGIFDEEHVRKDLSVAMWPRSAFSYPKRCTIAPKVEQPQQRQAGESLEFGGIRLNDLEYLVTAIGEHEIRYTEFRHVQFKPARRKASKVCVNIGCGTSPQRFEVRTLKDDRERTTCVGDQFSLMYNPVARHKAKTDPTSGLDALIRVPLGTRWHGRMA